MPPRPSNGAPPLDSDFVSYSFAAPSQFSAHADRLRLLLAQLRRSLPDSPPPAAAIQTALKGLTTELEAAEKVLRVYRERSKIYVLVHCQPLCGSLKERAAGIAAWLALLEPEMELGGFTDLRKKVADLAHDLQRSDLKVTENEERVYCTLQKEGQGRQFCKAVQNAIIMDLARALGTSPENHTELAEQIKLLKANLEGSSSASERRILMSLEKIFETCSNSPNSGACTTELSFEEDAHIPPFTNFLCPLTKEVMKDPVVLESSQTYERMAIQHWFDRCIEDGREPTCPVSGQVLNSLEQKPNIGLAGAIEEWVNRNVDLQIKSALQYLAEDSSYPVNDVERVLDNVHNISEEHPSSRYKIRNAGVVVLIVKMLKNSSKSLSSHIRNKALLSMVSMAKDEECKLSMIEEGAIRLAIHSLSGNSETEKEYAVKLLLEFSSDEDYCKKIASQKGSLLLLSSMAGDLENPTLSNLAEEVLKNMEKMEENVKHLAAAGRFQPLLARLCGGNEKTKTDMAVLVGNMTLPSNGKELIARQGAKVLVHMLSKPYCEKSSLQALHNLSTLDDNASILLDSGALPALTKVLFNQGSDETSELKEFAALTVANMASKPGHWELATADSEGHLLQSEFTIHRLLRIVPHVSPKCQVAVLQILCGIVSSPQASELAATHVKRVGGIGTILTFLENSEADIRLYAFRLTSLLSEKVAKPLAVELKTSNKLLLLKESLLDPKNPYGERSDAAQILSNIPLSSDDVKVQFEISLIPWVVTTLKEVSSVRSSRASTSMAEGLLGILLHFVNNPDPVIQSAVQENKLMNIFLEHLTFSSLPRVKQKAAIGLKYISESSKYLITAKDFEPQLPRGFCASLMFMCRKAQSSTACPVHGIGCDENSKFCLIKGNAVKPLVDLLHDENRDVQMAAVEALSTLLSDPYNLTSTVEELEKLKLTDNVTALFSEVRPGLLQEGLIRMVERFLNVESYAQVISADQSLVKALVEAFKHGNANTKRSAQEALTSLKQISGVGVRRSNVPNQGR